PCLRHSGFALLRPPAHAGGWRNVAADAAAEGNIEYVPQFLFRSSHDASVVATPPVLGTIVASSLKMRARFNCSGETADTPSVPMHLNKGPGGGGGVAILRKNSVSLNGRTSKPAVKIGDAESPGVWKTPLQIGLLSASK